MKKEADRLFNLIDYLSKNNEEIISLTDSDWDFLNPSRVFTFEKPDIIIEKNNVLYAIEHFQFNASKQIEKKGKGHGNSFNYIDNSFHKSISFVNKIEKVNIQAKLEFYVENFLSAFNKHCEKVELYKQNIVEWECFKTKEIKMGLWCEDNIPFGTYILNEKFKTSIVPLMIDEIYHKVKQVSSLDFLIFTTESPIRTPYMFLAELKKLNKSVIMDINEDNFFVHEFNNIERTIQYRKNSPT